MMFGKNRGIRELGKWIPAGSVGVEIGVWRGDGSEILLQRAGFLHMVDPWAVDAYAGPNEFGGFDAYLQRYSELVGSSDPADFQRYYDQVYREVVARFQGRPVAIHRQNSREFFASFHSMVDWVYIDGSHEEKTVLQDIVDASAIVYDSVMGDDYGVKPGVTAAVNKAASGRCLELFNRGQWRIS